MQSEWGAVTSISLLIFIGHRQLHSAPATSLTYVSASDSPCTGHCPWTYIRLSQCSFELLRRGVRARRSTILYLGTFYLATSVSLTTLCLLPYDHRHFIPSDFVSYKSIPNEDPCATEAGCRRRFGLHLQPEPHEQPLHLFN